MERTAWTDERLDVLARRMETGFGRVDADLRELRGEVRAQGEELRGEIATLGTELRGEIGGVRGEIGGVRAEIDALRITLIRVGGAMMAGLVGVIVAVLAGG